MIWGMVGLASLCLFTMIAVLGISREMDELEKEISSSDKERRDCHE